MKSNPYHSSIHCADVVRSMHVLVTRGGMSEYIDELDTSLLLCWAIKLCEFGHVYADHRSHIDWSHRLEEEMFNQGDFERSLGLPVY